MTALLEVELGTMKKALLGQILMERGVITTHQLEQALKMQDQKGGFIGELLIDLGHISERDYVAAVVVQCQIPYIAIDRYDISEEVLRALPAGFARRHHLIPLDYANQILNVVMADPLDLDVKNEMRRLTGCRIVPFIATRREIDRALQRWYGNAI